MSLENAYSLSHPNYDGSGQHEARLRVEIGPSNKQLLGVRKDGTEFWEERRAFLIDWDGELAVCLIRLDTSEQKNAIDSLAQNEKRLACVVRSRLS